MVQRQLKWIQDILFYSAKLLVRSKANAEWIKFSGLAMLNNK